MVVWFGQGMVEEEGMKKDYMWEALSNSDFIKNAIMELLSKHMPPVTGGISH